MFSIELTFCEWSIQYLTFFWENDKFHDSEVAYVTIGNPAFDLFLYLTGAHLRGDLQHFGDVSEQKIKYWLIRTWEIGGVRL